MIDSTTRSSRYEQVRQNYIKGLWDAKRLEALMKKGVITEEEYHLIVDRHPLVPPDSELGIAILEQLAKEKAEKSEVK